jgi:hypothetical protein
MKHGLNTENQRRRRGIFVVVAFENSKLRRSGIVGEYVAPTELADFYAGGSTNMPRLRRWKKARRDDGEGAAAGACRFGLDGF